MRGIEHKFVQRCKAGHLFSWAPAPGWCPYCDLTPQQRTKSLGMLNRSIKPDPCAAECCNTPTTQGG